MFQITNTLDFLYLVFGVPHDEPVHGDQLLLQQEEAAGPAAGQEKEAGG